MPKTSNTRGQRAKELLNRLERGPSSGFATFGHFDFPELSVEQRKSIQEYFEKSYRLWSETWVLNDVRDLIPELRK